MSRLTKTQTALVTAAQRRGGTYSVECGSGRGSRGGRISFGSRERDALFALEKAGVVRITGRQSDGTWWTGNGNQVRTTILTFELI